MRIGRAQDLPEELQGELRRATRLAWVNIVFLTSTVVVMYIVLGSSQAMKAAWLEDLLGLVPAIAFLVASRYRHRTPDPEHPYGYHRSVAVAYLFSSVVILGMGSFIVLESVKTLLEASRPTIGSVTLFGHTLWLGWLMIAALMYTIVPGFIIGRLQIPLATRLQDKALYANAMMLKADWATAAAGVVGIMGIAIGLWWADAVAAIFIGSDVVKDGWDNIRTSVRELADGRPTLVDGSAVDPLGARLQTEVASFDWVEDAHVRVRNEGHVFFAEVTLVPAGGRLSGARAEEMIEHLRALDWRLGEVSITPATTIEAVYEQQAT